MGPIPSISLATERSARTRGGFGSCRMARRVALAPVEEGGVEVRLHNVRARVLRALMAAIRRVRPVPRLPRAPWSPIDAFAHGLVRLDGRYYDLAFEAPYRSFAEWDREWRGYFAACWFAPAAPGAGEKE